MFRDTTARNRAHQRFGEEHYGWLIFAKALPWIAATIGLCVLVGPERVAAGVGGTVAYLAESRERTAVALFAFAGLMWWTKRRWRRNDYRP